ncbi:MAG: PleD family two-component response regulator [Candidatus Krumholzibacteriia bacterium]|jgi:PleD family two-component response regulator
MASKARILIADDEPHIRRILQFLLENEGFEVETAEDGEEAWKAVASFQPDLVLLDVMMPRMDGFSVLEIIRAGFETARLPVILLTAKGEDSDKVDGLKGGANDYIVKPFNHDELLLRVSNLLEATRREREANPLTGLPGNRAIEREIQSRIGSGRDYSFMYIDIDRFKSFNDFYGYSRGDRAISYVAGVLVGCTQKYGSGWEFVGHVGGDDFVVATDGAGGDSLARRIIEEFDAGVVALHDPADFARGYLEVEGRNGELNKFPLITLTLAVVNGKQGRFEHPAELSDVLVELKRFGKTTDSSVVVRERRSRDGEPELILIGEKAQSDTNDNDQTS